MLYCILRQTQLCFEHQRQILHSFDYFYIILTKYILHMSDNNILSISHLILIFFIFNVQIPLST